MQSLGQTRTSHQANHLLHTPDAFVRAPLPGMKNATAIVHITPAGGAAFTQYTVEFEAGGSLGPSRLQRFVYVIEGEIAVGSARLSRSHYACIPQAMPRAVSALEESRIAVIERPYVPLEGRSAPALLIGDEAIQTPSLLMDDPWIEVRGLVPDDPAFDYAVNTMTFRPGASLPMVETHVMEHGLLMLEGGGIYRLGDGWYPVAEGDFIWMAPFCPQWFGAIGRTPAKYLIYKDWNR